MKQNKETLKAYFETGDKPTQEQFSDLIDSYVDSKQPAGDPNRRFVINKNGDVGVASEQKTPEYTLSEITGKKLALLKDGVTVKEIDLTAYLDDTNLARLVSGSIDMNGLATFTRDDDSTFTLDLSNLKDAVPQYQAGTNVTIDTVNPLQPVINFSSKDNSFVPYTGATNDVVLGNHSIDLGKLEDNTITNKNAVILEHQGVPFFRLGVKVNNGTTIGDDYWKSLGIGRDALKSAKGSVNAAYGARALQNVKGSNNIGIGFSSGYDIEGNYNVITGAFSAEKAKGSNNTITGARWTGRYCTGNYNVANGYFALGQNTGDRNVAIGDYSGYGFNGNNNTFIGSLNPNLIQSKKVVSSDPSKKYVIEAVDVASNAEITITSHGFTIGSRKLFFYEKDITDPTSQTLVNIGARNPRISIWEVIDLNTLKCLNETYLGNAIGRQTFTEFEEINNSSGLGHDAYPIKSNQVVLGDENIMEVTTTGDYISTNAGKGVILKTPDGTKNYKISIDNAGNIITTQVV